MPVAATLSRQGIQTANILRNRTAAELVEDAVRFDAAMLVASGALATRSGKKTGRSPSDKRVVETDTARRDVWWGSVNMPMGPDTFQELKHNAIVNLNRSERLYVIDAYANWHPQFRRKVRVVCSRPYHALFMQNLLIRPTAAELSTFGEPDMVIYNAGVYAADRSLNGLSSDTCVALNLDTNEMVIVGTEYAGEMKKGVFTAMNYWLPRQGVLSMHCSATEAENGDVTLFFGLSGTGKTTLSADPRRRLIGDDEHGWCDDGIFNIEGGCYAKCIGLDPQHEPQIYHAIRFGTVLENTVQDPETREVDFDDGSITENTRAAYPIDFIHNAKRPCQAGHANHVIFLTCDAFGILPPVSRLTAAQAKYHFLSGYTAKVAGTEVGIQEPKATFSSCYGAAFLVWHPVKYAEMLDERIQRHGADVWLVNTGWTGGPYGKGQRIPLSATRAIIDAIHAGQLDGVPTRPDPIFGVAIPESCPHVPAAILDPKRTWHDPRDYDAMARSLAEQFQSHFQQFQAAAPPEVLAAAPKIDG